MRRRGRGRSLWLGLAALALAGCDDDEGGYTPPTGADNGARCIVSAAGANACSSGECVSLTGGQIGQCTETCDVDCRFGGACIKLPDRDERLCLPTCDTGADCDDGQVCRPLDEPLACTAEGCQPAVPNAFCASPTG